MKTSIGGTQCVYTIVKAEVIRKALSLEEIGEFEEVSPWASALKNLSSLEDGEFYPLLMANAASTFGVERVTATMHRHGYLLRYWPNQRLPSLKQIQNQ